MLIERCRLSSPCVEPAQRRASRWRSCGRPKQLHLLACAAAGACNWVGRSQSWIVLDAIDHAFETTGRWSITAATKLALTRRQQTNDGYGSRVIRSVASGRAGFALVRALIGPAVAIAMQAAAWSVAAAVRAGHNALGRVVVPVSGDAASGTMPNPP